MHNYVVDTPQRMKVKNCHLWSQLLLPKVRLYLVSSLILRPFPSTVLTACSLQM